MRSTHDHCTRQASPLAPSLSVFTLTVAPFPTLASVVCVTLSFAHAQIIQCCLVLALFVRYFPEEKDMKTFERNAQRFETVCFPIFNTFPIAKKSFQLLLGLFKRSFRICFQAVQVWQRAKILILFIPSLVRVRRPCRGLEKFFPPVLQRCYGCSFHAQEIVHTGHGMLDRQFKFGKGPKF